MPGTPDVILLPVTNRTDSLAALKAVATQGEANPTADDGAVALARFLGIFRQFPRDGAWSPSRDVPINPVVGVETNPGENDPKRKVTPITHPRTASGRRCSMSATICS